MYTGTSSTLIIGQRHLSVGTLLWQKSVAKLRYFLRYLFVAPTRASGPKGGICAELPCEGAQRCLSWAGSSTEEVAVPAPLIGMPFAAFLTLLILSAFAAAIVHWAMRYRIFEGVDGFLGQWMVGWLGAWLGPAVLGHWSVLVANIYLAPALLGAFAGAFAGTLNAKIMASLGRPSAT